MFYVYLLRSINFPNQTYVGITEDLKKRINKHNTGGSEYTAKYKPWNLVSYLAFKDETKARKFEKYLKSGSGRAFSKKRLL